MSEYRGEKEVAIVSRDAGPDLANNKSLRPRVHCREIAATDIGSVLDLLKEGFPKLPRPHWVAALDILATRPVPEGMPRYGYMLESDGSPVGLILVIVSEVRRNGVTTIRSNGAAWYVRPDFQFYGSIPLDRTLRLLADVHLNVFPAAHTFPIIEAKGFARFTNGISLSVPALIWRGPRARITNAGRLSGAEHPMPDEDRTVLEDHVRAGCIALWCETLDGGYPFVFRRRMIKARLPCAQLIYCRDLEDLVRLAGPVGRYLLQRGLPTMLVASNGRIPGVPGLYIDNKYPMYYRGQAPHQPNDLAYTEAALFGF